MLQQLVVLLAETLVAEAVSHLAVLQQLVVLHAETLVAEAAKHHVLPHLAVLPSVAVATSQMRRKVEIGLCTKVLTTRMDGKS